MEDKTQYKVGIHAKTGPSKFNQQIFKRRIALGFSQVELARRMGDGGDGNSISAWETGRWMPQPERLHALAAALDWTYEELIAHTELDVSMLGKQGSHKAIAAATLAHGTQPIVGNVFVLGNGLLHGREVNGSVEGFAVTVIAPVSFDDMCLEWAVALVETATGFATVSMEKALAKLRDDHPDWTIYEGAPYAVRPELE